MEVVDRTVLHTVDLRMEDMAAVTVAPDMVPAMVVLCTEVAPDMEACVMEDIVVATTDKICN